MKEQRHRRFWSVEEKRSLVLRAFADGAIVSQVARAAAVSPSQLYKWRSAMATAMADGAGAEDVARVEAHGGMPQAEQAPDDSKKAENSHPKYPGDEGRLVHEVERVGMCARDVPDRRIALLIDAENISHNKIAVILADLAHYGTVNIRRAYGNWASADLKGWQNKLHDFAIRPIQQFSYSTGKNATDFALVIDAMELLYTQKPDVFCLASSDADFTPLAMHIRTHGHDVYGFGERKTPAPFVHACTMFRYLDVQDDVAVSTDTARITPVMKLPGKRPSLSTELVILLREAVRVTAREDGWSSIAVVGNVARNQAVNPRNYGAKNLTALLMATGLFIIEYADNGVSYVADKFNKERTPKPA